jgi:Na+/H+-dicarboxylate symporter
VVNVLSPGKNMDPTFVEEHQKEGAKEVSKAHKSMDHAGDTFQWGKRESVATTLSATSELELSSSQRNLLSITLECIGSNITTPAKVVAKWSSDGEKFEAVQWLDKDGKPDGKEFAAGKEPDVYTRKVELPAESTHIRLDFSAQQGGVYSQVSAEITPGSPTIADVLKNLILMLFTGNLLESMVSINLLPLIVFSIVFAGMLTTMGERSQTIANFILAINDALMSFILLLMKFAPIGIFCLVAARFGKAQVEGKFLELIRIQSMYIGTVIGGLAIHALITIPVILWVFTKRNPYVFMMQMSQAILTAFSTASSTATLPVTMECAESQAGISKRSTEFVLPLGATINMDGTALYEAAAAIFIAQSLGSAFELTLAKQVVIAVSATLAAIGAAGIPEAGLVTMLIVLNAVGLPIELIGLIIPVDWLLDRFRTAVNNFGDAAGAAIVDRSFESPD